ncbi:hypothetical protein Tco_0855832 [Tanacetum coccineum]
MKVKTPPDSPLVTVIDPDNQPMRSNTRTVPPTPTSVIVQIPILNNLFIKGDDRENGMARHYGMNEKMKNHVVELEHQINQELRNHQAIIQNLEKQILQTESLPRITNTKLRHEFVYKSPSIQNENDKGDAEVIKENETLPIPTMSNPSPIMTNSPTVSSFHEDCIVHIPYMNAKMFVDDVLLNQAGGEELNFDRWRWNRKEDTEVRTRKSTIDVPKEPNQ